MDIRPALLAFAVVTLSGCSSNDYGYGYCYGPGGPRGYYYGPLEPKPACATQAAASVYYRGLHPAAGRREPYFSGPYAEVTPAAAR